MKNQKIKRIILAIAVACVIEIVICNFPAFRTVFSGNCNKEVAYEIHDGIITIPNVNVRATSVWIQYQNTLTDKITYHLTYVAEEDDAPVTLNPKLVLENDAQYIQFDTHSVCKSIEIQLQTESDLEIAHILINHPNFHINIYRLLILFVIVIFIIKVRDKSIYTVMYDENSRLHHHRFILNLIAACFFIGIYTICQQNADSLWIKPEEIPQEDAILMQTEAFMHGQIPLLHKPSDALLEMEDPYNYTKKIENDVPFLYDVTYYEGAYYSYFGITPIITLVLPFRAITGMYVQTYIFNLVYIFAIIFLLYDVYRQLIRRWVPKISLCNFYLGYFAIITASNVLTTLRGAKYDIVTTAGIVCILLSIKLAISIGKSEKLKTIKSILLGISMAGIVLSKPTFIVYYPVIVFFIFYSIKAWNCREKIKTSIAIAIPLGIFAILQMLYNVVRFDNPLEFGAKYQLTSFNMQYCMHVSLGKIYAGILEYILRTPTINPVHFPFVFINTNLNGLSMNEICYEHRLVGLIAIPILWIYFFKKQILEDAEKDLKIFINICLMTALVAIIINTCTGGICEAYAVDFKCLLAIGAILLLCKKVNQKENNALFMLLCITTICIMLPINLTTESNWLIDMASSTTVFLRNIFEFWA